MRVKLIEFLIQYHPKVLQKVCFNEPKSFVSFGRKVKEGEMFQKLDSLSSQNPHYTFPANLIHI